MRVQVYRIEDGPARVFAQRECYMLCELNAYGCATAEASMRKLGFRRAGPWKRYRWGHEARFRRARTATGTGNG